MAYVWLEFDFDFCFDILQINDDVGCRYSSSDTKMQGSPESKCRQGLPAIRPIRK